MKNKSNKLVIEIAIFFQMVLIVTAIHSVERKQWKNLALSLLAIACLTLPFLIAHIANKKKITLPPSFQIVTLVSIFLAQYLGELKKFYIIFWWWDLFLHIISGSYTIIIALYSMQGVIRKSQPISEQRFTLLTVAFAFCFSVSLGTLWEMFEFIVDYFFKTNMVKGGLEDTSTDIIAKIFAALITSIIYYYKKMKILPHIT